MLSLFQLDAWFVRRGWSVFPFQRDVWNAALAGESGLLHATTGSGKTYALWGAALLRGAGARKAGLRVLWLTPMRALAADTLRALQEAALDLAPGWAVDARTGDTSTAQRARQARRLPDALVTTPESLTLMLSKADARQQFAQLDMVIVDEWHELMGNKRGVQTQLALARLRRWHPALVVWGLSATLGNLARAKEVLLGAAGGVTVEGEIRKEIVVDTLIPEQPSRFPWAGHLGLQMLQPVVAEIDKHAATLVFTNTRAQAEVWYQHLLEARPDWAGSIALHHGSLAREVREWVELGLKKGQLKAVVCTSSLDLGVDFLPVERVLQIGSAKGIARLLQRAGRSGHAPGRASRVTLVPTHSLELLEAAGARQAVAARRIESRQAPDKPLDVLVQHLVTMALGGGFKSEELYDEVRGAWSYRDLTREEWQWALDFVARGGQSLTVYPEYRRVLPDDDGVYRVPDAAVARRHRMSMGTIVSDASIEVKFMNGARIGTVDESFISRLRKDDHFLFGGRILAFVRVHEMTAYVRRASGGKGAVPRWQGGKMPLSSELAHAALDQLCLAEQDIWQEPEMVALKPLLAIQRRWSALPTPRRTVVETLESREGHHLFIYPFAGRAVHLGLAALFAWRIARTRPVTLSIAVNDYGLELLAPEMLDWAALFKGDTVDSGGDQAQDGRGVALFDTAGLLEDVLASLNATELAQRRFREIARIAGLVFQGYPGQPKSARQLQASSSLFYEVFRKHDAANLLLTQAQREVLEQELDLTRLRETLLELQARSVSFHALKRATPFGFSLMVERLREKLTTEKLSERVARMLRALDKAAGP
ncbi:MAG: ligase-associated DNA damage response DEXH box helicase [Pseudomonadota bacterium]